MRKTVPASKRFWGRIHVREDGCWQWQGRLSAAGYGRISDRGVVVYAHRFAYELLVAPIGPGLEIDHLCRNRGCVNPAHLEAVSHRENILRSPVCPIAENARKTHCPKGHPYDEMHTYSWGSTGWRLCRTCANDRRRASRYQANTNGGL